MPASAVSNRPEDVTERLGASVAARDGETLLKALREVKNQIIGNKTKKLLYIHLGAVPKIVAVISAAASGNGGYGEASVVVQAAAAIGSFACGVEDGVHAVLAAGAVPHLIQILSYSNGKVVNAGARTLRIIFQSKLAPKYDVLQVKNMKFLLSLLNSHNENLNELAARIIAHSCDKYEEQKVLCDAGVLKRLVELLDAASNQRDAYIDSVVAVVKNNSEVTEYFLSIGNGRAWSSLIEIMHDRNPQTRYLACVCLVAIGKASCWNSKELQTKTKLMLVLVELLEEPSQAGDEASFALSDLLADKEELHKQAISINVVEKLCKFLESSLPARRLEGILLVLAEICSKLETGRYLLLSLQVLNHIAEALKHECAEVRIAACLCIRNISRSIKNLSAGCMSNETVLVPLVRLLHDPSTYVQDAALGAVCNLAVDFTFKKPALMKYGGVSQLIQLSKSMDSTIRLKSLWALRNLTFVADRIGKEFIASELTVFALASLICDPEFLIQEQAMALICNLIHGCADFIKLVFAEECLIMNAVTRQLKSDSATQVCVQGMLLLCNVAAGDQSHKEAVLSCIIPSEANGTAVSFILRFMRNKDHFLRTASVWCILNLTIRDGANSPSRVRRLQNAGIVSQIKSMVNDPWLDCKFRVRTVLEQCSIVDSTST
ncbi:hypothetical protein AXF42_Ash004396 [Apostasia shenzhenica]|uniref:Uncharacterized protein n=1 Tax=Apostasia shenzhenica TaxID=1088818 RepID=A0A2I0A2U4_9ASPA|nr:hypothetical protein AXF42_Ash004396 [Apostasia shenzhenica]